MADRAYATIAEQFQRDVLKGAFPAGAMFKAAVTRQVNDLASPPAGYRWDEVAADKACQFAEALAFPKGGTPDKPIRGLPFRLEGWQVWLLRTLFGWMDAVTGSARFHKSLIFMCKGNGKTPLAAIIALNVVARGRSIGAKAYSAASTQKQAREVFEAAQEMLRLSPDLRSAAGLVVSEHAIKGIGDNRIFEPISSESGTAEGKVPNCVIVDEIHVHPNRKLYDNLLSAASKVDGSRVVVISTAGHDMAPEAIGYQLYREACGVLTGAVDSPATFALVVEADKDRDPWDPETWRQANPNLGVSISERNFKTAADGARDLPSSRPDFLTKRLGWWQQSANIFLDIEKWRSLVDPDLGRLEDLPAGTPLYLGVDLARTQDISAVVAVAVTFRGDGQREYRVFSRMAYLPDEAAAVKATPEFRQWASEGWISLTRGPTTSFGQIKSDIAAACEKHPGAEICFDDFMAAEMEEDLASRGLTVFSIRQGAKQQSGPMEELEAAVLDGRLKHDGSPVMDLCITNLQAKSDGAGKIQPHRESPYQKIDLGVALVNALARAMVADPPFDFSGGLQWI